VKCLSIHVPKDIMEAHVARENQTPAQTMLINSYGILIGVFLGAMVSNLIFTCWYHNSFKQWAARETVVYNAEHPEVKADNEMMAPAAAPANNMVVEMMDKPIATGINN
jgi:hypothetical protein